MRCLILQQSPSQGGALTFVNRVNEYCVKKGIETYLICSESQIEWFENSGINLIINPELGTIKINTHPIKIFLKVIDEIIRLNKVIRVVKPDFIIVSNIAQGTLLGSLVFKIPLLFFFHTYPNYGSDWFTKSFVKLFSNSSTLFITVSKFSATSVSRYLGLPECKVRVVYNYASEFSASPYNKGKTIINVLTIGHITAIKNPGVWLTVALNVVKKCDHVNFSWAGEGDMLTSMRTKAEESGYSSRISFIGFKEDVETLYKSSDIYFQPSLVESHGIAVVDAMSYALPAVVSNSGGLPESVEHGVTGIVHHHSNTEGFTDSILWLAKNPDMRMQFGETGKKKCDALFSKQAWENKLSEYLEIIQS